MLQARIEALSPANARCSHHARIVAVAAVVSLGWMVWAPAGAAAQRGPGGLAGGVEPELEIVDRFDTDGDERLDAGERAAARRWLDESGPAAGGRGRRPLAGIPGPGGARGISRGTPGPRVGLADVTRYEAEHLYDIGVLRTIFIEFEDEGWEREMATFFNTDVEVPAVVTVDGRRYPDVGIGFRGASSFRMVPEGSKRSLNLSIDFVDDDQRIGGYRTLNLLNVMNDPTFVRTALYSAIARDYLPAPAVNFVKVVINGEYWGVYQNAQQFNKDFLNDFFNENDGIRWKAPGSPNGSAGLEYLGPDPAPYRRLFEIRSSDRPEYWADLIELTRVLNETPSDRLVTALDPILNIDGALRFLAIEMALVNSDGYWTRASDYNLYQDEAGRFHILPHDMNEALGVSGNVNLDPLVGLNDRSKPLRSRLLAVPELREQYLEYVEDIATRWLNWNTIGPLVSQYQDLIDEAVASDTRKLYSTDAFASEVSRLRDFVERRNAFLLR